MKAATTLPRLLHRNAASFGHRPAWREKRGGIWQEMTWSEYATIVSHCATGLAAHGFARGDRLVVIGDNRPRLYAAMLAAQSLGGTAVPLWPDAEPDLIALTINHAGASVAVVEDAEQLEKIAEVKPILPKLHLVVQTTSHGMRQAGNDWLKSFEQLTPVNGSATEQSEPGDIALLLYERTTVDGVRNSALSHATMLTAADTLQLTDAVRQSDQSFSWLPMAWFADAFASQALALTSGFTCNCPENPEAVWRDLREVGPTILIAPPRIWEAMFEDIEARASQASGVKGALFRRFRSVAERAELCRQDNRAVPSLLRLQAALAELLICAPLRDQIGLRRLRWAHTAGEQLTPRVLQGFRALGVNLKQQFGMPLSADVAGEPAHA